LVIAIAEILARSDENADGHGHFLAGNEVLHHLRNAEYAFRIDRPVAVLKYQNGSSFLRVILRRNVNPILADCIRIHLAVKKNRPSSFPLGTPSFGSESERRG